MVKIPTILLYIALTNGHLIPDGPQYPMYPSHFPQFDEPSPNNPGILYNAAHPANQAPIKLVKSISQTVTKISSQFQSEKLYNTEKFAIIPSLRPLPVIEPLLPSPPPCSAGIPGPPGLPCLGALPLPLPQVPPCLYAGLVPGPRVCFPMAPPPPLQHALPPMYVNHPPAVPRFAIPAQPPLFHAAPPFPVASPPSHAFVPGYPLPMPQMPQAYPAQTLELTFIAPRRFPVPLPPHPKFPPPLLPPLLPPPTPILPPPKPLEPILPPQYPSIPNFKAPLIKCKLPDCPASIPLFPGVPPPFPIEVPPGFPGLHPGSALQVPIPQLPGLPPSGGIQPGFPGIPPGFSGPAAPFQEPETPTQASLPPFKDMNMPSRSKCRELLSKPLDCWKLIPHWFYYCQWVATQRPMTTRTTTILPVYKERLKEFYEYKKRMKL